MAMSRLLCCFLLVIACQTHAQESTDRERVFAEYATLRTIAGLGEEEDANFWKDEFEGADARTIELSNPHMTMADAAGNYYIADKESHSILRVDPEGKVHTHAGTHEAGINGDEGLATEMLLNNPNGLFVHPNGVVFVLDFFNLRVCKVDLAGHLTTMFRDSAGFGPGRGLWVSRDETLVYFNGPSSVKRWTPGGGIETVVPSIADSGNLTVDPDGHLIVTSRGDHLVYRVGADGALTIIAGNGSDSEATEDGFAATEVGLESARAVAFLPDGTFFIATQKGGDVWFVDRAGFIHKFIGGLRNGNVRSGDGDLFSTPGNKISEPRAITLSPNGDLVITTNDKGFIRVVERFQPPEFTWLLDQRLSITVTPGRSHLVETSNDLRAWEIMKTLERSERTMDLSVMTDESRFVRVRW
ncbi:MAG: streptogramin lyase [Verrucomicrobiales bacterium]|jgi:streptogramin lyase